MNPQTSSTLGNNTEENPYIRTYAKDYARLASKDGANSLPTSVKNSEKKSQQLFARKESPQRSAPLVDESLITHDQQGTKVETPDLTALEHEAELRDTRITQEQRDISDQLSELNQQVAEPINLPPIQPSAISTSNSQPPSSAVPQGSGNIEQNRESLLERLRARAQARTDTNAGPVLQPILPRKIESDLPSVPIEQTPLPPTPTAHEPVPLPPVKQHADEPAPFHSFSTDFADRINTEQASTFSVLAAEENTPAQIPVPRIVKPRKKLGILPVAAGILLILAGGAALVVAYQYTRQHAPAPLTPSIPSLITPDQTVALTGSDVTNALAQQAMQPLPQGQVEVTYITNASTTQQGVVQLPQPGGALLAALNLGAPDILLRNIDPSSTVGIVHAGSETRPFFLLKVESYDRTFLGMLNWETTMQQNLSAFYPPYPADTTASTTGTTTTVAQLPPQFTDAVVDSHSVRELQDNEGRTLLLYGYTANKQVLIIARDEAAFSLLLNRLSASGN